MALFRRKTVEPTPDWNRLQWHLQSGEKRVGVCRGWLVGEGIDHPCGVYLTNRALYVDIREEALTHAQTIAIPFDTIEKCGIDASDPGSPPLLVVGRESARDVAVHLRCSDALKFGERVVQLAKQ